MSITDELGEWWVRKFPIMDKELHKDFTAIADRIDAAVDGMIELPKDADGEHIHVGDVMEWVRYKDDDSTIVRTVSGIGNDVFFAWSDEQGRYAQYEAHAYRHHHAPTVEDVLREFTDAILEWSGKSGTVAEVGTWSDVAAEYAAKLRLANNEE